MIVLRHRANGQQLQWPEGEPYNGLEWEAVSSTANEDIFTLEDQLFKDGIQWGDAVAWITKQIGVTQCTACAARQQILNKMHELGLTETVRQIKATL